MHRLLTTAHYDGWCPRRRPRSRLEPLFIYDEKYLRSRCCEAVEAFGHQSAVYATKFFFVGRWSHSEGMMLDVASGGELYIAFLQVCQRRRACSMETTRVWPATMAVDAGVHRIVVDSFDEIDV